MPTLTDDSWRPHVVFGFCRQAGNTFGRDDPMMFGSAYGRELVAQQPSSDVPLDPPDNVLGERQAVNQTQFVVAVMVVGLVMIGGVAVIAMLYHLVRMLLEALL